MKVVLYEHIINKEIVTIILVIVIYNSKIILRENKENAVNIINLRIDSALYTEVSDLLW